MDGESKDERKGRESFIYHHRQFHGYPPLVIILGCPFLAGFSLVITMATTLGLGVGLGGPKPKSRGT